MKKYHGLKLYYQCLKNLYQKIKNADELTGEITSAVDVCKRKYYQKFFASNFYFFSCNGYYWIFNSTQANTTRTRSTSKTRVFTFGVVENSSETVIVLWAGWLPYHSNRPIFRDYRKGNGKQRNNKWYLNLAIENNKN